MPNLFDHKIFLDEDFCRFRIGYAIANIIGERLFKTCCFRIKYTNIHSKNYLSRFRVCRSLVYIYKYSI